MNYLRYVEKTALIAEISNEKRTHFQNILKIVSNERRKKGLEFSSKNRPI